ncbi:hypothetical protein Pan216_23140 [Planctomycetes bacterium Pan216]|uniref:Uncharacterized protein n=1 Tax=Kolteria novifilia TaxID=2527975 RepID=A0A518B3A4_9BACT|nr:hypothetical protein Pan216_23140 [Planctomycetes bacterium Pan216]
MNIEDVIDASNTSIAFLVVLLVVLFLLVYSMERPWY